LDNQLAKLYLKSGDYKQAEILFQDVLKIRQVELGDYHPLVSACYTNLAIIEKYNGNYKKAIFYIEKDLQSCIDYFGENHKDTAKSYMNIGIFYSLIGNFPESLKSISKGVAIYESLTDSNDIELPKFYSLLANTYIHNQDFIQARELFTKTLKIIRGKKSYSLVSLLNNFGVTYEREKSFQRAETFYRRAYKASRYLYGPDHIETANILSNISVVLDHLGNHQKALELSEESLRLKSIHFPKEHILILRHRVNVVEFFIHAELIQEANEKLNLLRQDIIRWNVYDKEIMSEMDKLEKEIQNQKEISVDPRKF
jgi:tetratricopeptide (TPR) repeat protein